MIQLLLAVVLITVCKAQYGEVAPPSLAQPINYASNIPEEIPYTSEPSYSGNEYENVTKEIVQSESNPPSTQLLHPAENITCGSPIDDYASSSSIPTITQSTVNQINQTSRQPLISSSTKSSPRISKVSSFRPRTTTSSLKPQSLSTRSSTRPTRHTTRITTKHSRITSTSKKPTQTISRITQSRTSETSRSTRLSSTIPTQPGSTRKPESRPITLPSRRSDCSASDTLFVVDSTSSVKRFFEDHREYIIETINLILPEIDNETRIGIVEYSSPLRRQVKLPFIVHKNRTEIVETIKKLPFFAGITATGAALKLALELLQDRRSNVLTNVVVVTDGFSYDLVDEPSSMLHRLPNVRTFTATVTDSWREYELETIAGERKRVFKGKNSARDLAKALTSCDNGSRLRGLRQSN
uniref:VWFA domain-containing protein n=1 Tax=Loa loa TaxID=7209 RepID=A0A1I7VI27_LOALO